MKNDRNMMGTRETVEKWLKHDVTIKEKQAFLKKITWYLRVDPKQSFHTVSVSICWNCTCSLPGQLPQPKRFGLGVTVRFTVGSVGFKRYLVSIIVKRFCLGFTRGFDFRVNWGRMHMYMPHATIFAVTETFVSTSRESIWKLSSACTHIKKAYLKAL